MCRTNVAAKEAEIARFLSRFPRAADAGRGHPALQGCEDVRWSGFPECPAGIPVLLHSLLDRTAASEADRVLTNCLYNSISEMNVAVPVVLPFLIRLAGDPQVPVRSELLGHLVTFVEFSEPVDTEVEAMVLWFGSDSDHPERAQCRAVFAEHASAVAILAEELPSPDDRAKLLQAAGLG
ncbi:hypothetical protein [Streptomyces sp. NPDC005435]|uniref:hypothetical protein n=1 Tax=Streptomyces sp. NPDC005435 TaxID=3154464 RepID=UPI0034554FDA